MGSRAMVAVAVLIDLGRRSFHRRYRAPMDDTAPKTECSRRQIRVVLVRWIEIGGTTPRMRKTRRFPETSGWPSV